MDTQLSGEQLEALYTWVDTIPLSRPKRNITRDFSDGVLFAEVIHHYHPSLIEVHNYSAANGLSQKMYNWETMGTKVFGKLHLSLSKEEMQAVATGKPNYIERLLLRLRGKLAQFHSPAPPKLKGSYGTAGSRQRSGSRSGPRPGPGAGIGPGPGPGRAHGQGRPERRIEHEYEDPDSRYDDDVDVRDAVYYDDAGSNNAAAKLRDKDDTIAELRDTVKILELKVGKLEQLVQLKDNKIDTLKHQRGIV